ncbi:MAG: TIGR02281 family clan AA aspartic protease [Rhodobacteraceae bacterium]|nr:TIGR02281 family clan AA aspartic protease [Paracoccaceae bacterium]
MRDLNGDDQVVLVYLILLLLIVGGSMIISSRAQLNKTLQQMAIWGLIFIGAIGAYSMRDQIEAAIYPERPVISERGTVSFTRNRDGHFYAELEVNGRKVGFVVDTGATEIVLSEADAERLGYPVKDLIYSGRASTANGIVQTARITLKTVTLGRFRDQNLPATVNGGALETSLLGMRYLGLFRKIEIAGSKMTLTR